MATKIKWEDADFAWDSADYTWEDVTLVEELVSGGATGDEILWNVEQLDPEKKKRFIRLICKVKGIKVYDEQKTTKKMKISTKDIDLLIKEMFGKIIVQ